MNVLAGVLIGLFANGWTGRLLSPFLWAVMFCGFQAIHGGRRDVWLARARPGGTRLGDRAPLVSFYAVEYVTASLTSLLISGVTGILVGLL